MLKNKLKNAQFGVVALIGLRGLNLHFLKVFARIPRGGGEKMTKKNTFDSTRVYTLFYCTIFPYLEHYITAVPFLILFKKIYRK